MLDWSIVIPTSGRRDSLEKCLNSICLQKNLQGRYEILLIVNPPSPEVAAWVTSLNIPECRVLSSPAGTSRARNIGLQEAKGKFVFFLDDDCQLPDNHHLERRAKWYYENQSVSLLGGFYENPAQISFWGRAYNEMTKLWLQRGSTEADSYFFLGGNLSIRVDDRSRQLRFPEDKMQGGEEAWFRHQAKQLQMSCRVSSDFPVAHASAHTIGTFVKRAWQHGQVQLPSGPKSSLLRNFNLFLKAPAKIWFPLMIYAGFSTSGKIAALLRG